MARKYLLHKTFYELFMYSPCAADSILGRLPNGGKQQHNTGNIQWRKLPRVHGVRETNEWSVLRQLPDTSIRACWPLALPLKCPRYRD